MNSFKFVVVVVSKVFLFITAKALVGLFSCWYLVLAKRFGDIKYILFSLPEVLFI